MQKRKLLIIVMAMIFLCIFYQIIMMPYIGIANNGDFERIMLPSGIKYMVNPWLEENYNDYFWGYITNAFEITKPQYNGWFSIYQVHIFLSKLVCRILSKTGAYDLRYLGFINMLIYMSGIYLILCWANREKNKLLRKVLMVLVFVLAVDGYVVQYMNAFYCEIGTICALLLFYGSLSLLICYEYSQRMELLLFSVACCAGVASVTMKQQDILCVAPATGILWLVFNKKILSDTEKKKKIRMNILVFSLFLMSVVSVTVFNKGAGNTTCYNVVCMDILKNSKNPEKHLDGMGLKQDEKKEILDGIGENAFSDRGRVLYQKYEGYFTRRNELKILAKEPSVFIAMMLDRSTKLFQDDLSLGNFTKETGLPSCAKSKTFRIWSGGGIKGNVYQSNIYFYLFVLIAASVLSVRLIKKNKQTGYLLLTMCVSNMLRFITVLLGDSSHDDIKHFFTLNVEFDVIFFALILAACMATGKMVEKAWFLNGRKKK